jgi:hypothetical protein
MLRVRRRGIGAGSEAEQIITILELPPVTDAQSAVKVGVAHQIKQARKQNTMEKIKTYTGWSAVFLLTTVFWFVFEQNQKAEGYMAASFPIIIAIVIMAHYERRIRLLVKNSPPANPN